MNEVEARRLKDEFLDTVLVEPWQGILLHRKAIRRTAGVDKQISALSLEAVILTDLYYDR